MENWNTPEVLNIECKTPGLFPRQKLWDTRPPYKKSDGISLEKKKTPQIFSRKFKDSYKFFLEKC